MKAGFKTLFIFVIIFGLGVGAAFGAGVAWERTQGEPTQTMSGLTSQMLARTQARSTAAQEPDSELSPGTQATPSAGQGSSMGSFGRQFGRSGGFGSMGGPPAAMGTVDKVEGDTITVTTDDGPVTVIAKDDTVVLKTSRPKVSDLQPGEQVIVSGEKDADGNITARAIQVGTAFGVNPGSPPDAGSTPTQRRPFGRGNQE